MIVGVLGIAIPRSGYGWVGRRVFTRRIRWRPTRVEDVTYPTYVSRNPANTRVQAGLPAAGAAGGTETARRDLTTEVRPVGEQEVTEDVYEE
jgi:hypothetical protein